MERHDQARVNVPEGLAWRDEKRVEAKGRKGGVRRARVMYFCAPVVANSSRYEAL